jgi:hypothetical protein
MMMMMEVTDLLGYDTVAGRVVPIISEEQMPSFSLVKVYSAHYTAVYSRRPESLQTQVVESQLSL